ncbi:hypothetical protein MRX96_039420 [Rhipicephalus microplus]
MSCPRRPAARQECRSTAGLANQPPTSLAPLARSPYALSESPPSTRLCVAALVNGGEHALRWCGPLPTVVTICRSSGVSGGLYIRPQPWQHLPVSSFLGPWFGIRLLCACSRGGPWETAYTHLSVSRHVRGTCEDSYAKVHLTGRCCNPSGHWRAPPSGVRSTHDFCVTSSSSQVQLLRVRKHACNGSDDEQVTPVR